MASTAAVYFHRFYTRNCFCLVDPRLMSVGCLYLASKSEESLMMAKHMVGAAAPSQCRPQQGHTRELTKAMTSPAA